MRDCSFRLALLLLSLLVSRCAKTTCYYLPHARLIDVSEQSQTEAREETRVHGALAKKNGDLLVGGHYLGKGDKVVLLIRKWRPGAPFYIDDESFEKLTIEVPTLEPGTQIDLPSETVRLWYSTGPCSKLRTAGGWYGVRFHGHMVIKDHTAGKVRAYLEIVVEARDTCGLFPDRVARFKGRYSFAEIAMQDLTPWLGKPDPYRTRSEYPP